MFPRWKGKLVLSIVLLLASGICWTVVYGACIKIGLTQKTYCMPVFALALNIAWEMVYAMNGTSIASGSSSSGIDPQTIVNWVWFLCDCVIVFTFFKYGKQWMPNLVKDHFACVGFLIFFTGAAAQLAFFFHLQWLEAAQYSAFAQNVVMSVLFVFMFLHRKGPEGQSLVIAMAKCIGTLAPTLQQGLVDGLNVYILIMGALCFLWDVIYICLLIKAGKSSEQHADIQQDTSTVGL